MNKIIDWLIDKVFGKLFEFSAEGCMAQMIFIIIVIFALGILIGTKG